MKPRHALALLAAATVSVAVATTAGAHDRSSPGGRLAFAIKDPTGNTDVYSVSPAGDRLRRLTTDATFDACPDYSRDGRRIAWCGSESGSTQIWVMNADGSDKHQVTTLASAFFPDFSPSATTVAFMATATAGASNQVYTERTDGSGLVQLTTAGGNFYPTYSPDGRRIAFISDRTGVEQVWVMNGDGTHQTQLTHSGVDDDQVPDWSPDGRRIAYQEGDPPNGHIWVMDADGTHNRQLTAGGDDFGAAWSPDGRQIAFVRDLGNGDRGVWRVNADGSDPQRVLALPVTASAPAWGPSR